MGRETHIVRAASAAVLAAALPQPAVAQTGAAPSTAPVIVSATRLPATADQFAGSASVITRAMIDARRPASTIDLLRRVPGLHIDQPGGRGAVSSVYLRGSDPNFTVVLIDGVKVNDPTNSRGGSFDFSTVDVGSIERVEIVRGPLSSVYGSDAIAGVINVVTRGGGAAPAISADLEAGGFGYGRAHATAGGPLGAGDAAVAASWVDAGEPIAGAEFVARGATAKLTAAPSETSLLRLTLRYADADAGAFPDDSGGPTFAVRRTIDDRDTQELTGATDFTHELTRRWSYTLDATRYVRTEDFASPGVAPGVRNPAGVSANSSDSRLERTTVSASTQFTLADGVALTAGADIQFEDGAADSIVVNGGVATASRFAQSRKVYASFAEARFSAIPRLVLEAGARLDYPDDFDKELSPRLAAAYTVPASRTRLRASWGRGFKLPSFFAVGSALVGNPTLRPETSESIEVGVDQPLWDGRAHASLTAFENAFFQVIDFDAATFQLVNRSEVAAVGAEAAFDVALTPALDGRAHLSFADTDIRNDNDELLDRPEFRAGAGAIWRPDAAWTVDFSVLYVGRVLNSSVPTGNQALAPYWRLDAAARWQPSPGWSLRLAIDNLADENYEEALGLPGPGLTPRLSLGVSF